MMINLGRREHRPNLFHLDVLLGRKRGDRLLTVVDHDSIFVVCSHLPRSCLAGQWRGCRTNVVFGQRGGVGVGLVGADRCWLETLVGSPQLMGGDVLRSCIRGLR
jgi:hypothetical protein